MLHPLKNFANSMTFILFRDWLEIKLHVIIMFLSLFQRKSETTVASKPSYPEIDCEKLRNIIYGFIRTIKDPEKPNTLEELKVVYENGVQVRKSVAENLNVVRIEFNPTVPHCSLATLIGLCIRIKLEQTVPYKFKLDIFIKKGGHASENEINKQINDKERIAAAMENPNLKKVVEQCIQED